MLIGCDIADAKAEGEPPAGLVAACCRSLPQPFGGNRNGLAAKLARHSEFVPANPSDHIRFAKVGFEQFSGLAQEPRALIVPKRVVDLFQTVEIDEQNREGELGPLGQTQRLLGEQMESPEIVKASQFVA